MYDLADSVFEAVLKLDDSFRAEHCINNIQEHNELTLLKEKGAEGCPLTLSLSEEEGAAIVPQIMLVWSHPRFAEHFLEVNGNYSKDDYDVVTLSLDLFKSGWLPMLSENNIGLGLMPIDLDSTIAMFTADVLTKSAQERAEEAKALAEQEKKEVEEELKEMEKAKNK